MNEWLASNGGVTAVLAIGAVFLCAGVVKGVIGLGLPTLSMALLALWMRPAQAAALLIVPSLITNLWQVRPWATLADTWRRTRGLQVGIVVGTVAGAFCFGAPAGATAAAALGVVLVAYGAWGLAGRELRVPVQHECWLGPLVGGVTGLVTAATGVFVVPAVPYLQALGLPRDRLIQAMGLAFTTSTLALGAGLAGTAGADSMAAAAGSVAMLLPALCGMALGQWLRQRLPVLIFRRCFFVGLAALGAYMVVRALG